MKPLWASEQNGTSPPTAASDKKSLNNLASSDKNGNAPTPLFDQSSSSGYSSISDVGKNSPTMQPMYATAYVSPDDPNYPVRNLNNAVIQFYNFDLT
jgi:hypothetical protein